MKNNNTSNHKDIYDTTKEFVKQRKTPIRLFTTCPLQIMTVEPPRRGMSTDSQLNDHRNLLNLSTEIQQSPKHQTEEPTNGFIRTNVNQFYTLATNLSPLALPQLP